MADKPKITKEIFENWRDGDLEARAYAWTTLLAQNKQPDWGRVPDDIWDGIKKDAIGQVEGKLGDFKWEPAHGEESFLAYYKKARENNLNNWLAKNRDVTGSIGEAVTFEQRDEAAQPWVPDDELFRNPDWLTAVGQLLSAMETAPSAGERRVLRADFLICLHSELHFGATDEGRTARRRAAASLAGARNEPAQVKRCKGLVKMREDLKNRIGPECPGLKLSYQIWPEKDILAAHGS